jgi:glutamate--cysteine ligase
MPSNIKNRLTRNDLIAYHLSGIRPRSELKVGIEVEKPAALLKDGSVPKFKGKYGYQQVINYFTQQLGWQVVKRVNGHPYMLQRGDTVLSLEVSGLIEFAGTPHRSLHDMALELELHRHELREVSRKFGIRWLGLAVHPISHQRDHDFIKYERYTVMQEMQGEKWSEWSQVTNSIQVNFDYSSQKNLEKKFHLMTRVAPILTAMFTNSSITLGKANGYASLRGKITTENDGARYTPPAEFFYHNFSVERFVNYVLDLPMIFIVRDEQHIPIKKLTFRQFLERGYLGHKATLDDYRTHISFLYSDVRLKHYIEYRSADSLPPTLVSAVPATVKGLMYDSSGWQFINKLTKYWTYEDYLQLRRDVVRQGLQAEIRGTKVLQLAKEVLNMASENLRYIARHNANGQDESIYLDPIKEFIFIHEKSPGEWTHERWTGDWHSSAAKLMDWAEY